AGRSGEGRPAAAGVVLRVGVEQLRTAAGAPVRPGLEDEVVLPAERRLGPLVAEDPILLGRQLLARLLLGLLDLYHEISLVGLGGFGGRPLAVSVRWSFADKDAGSSNSSAIRATEDAAQRASSVRRRLSLLFAKPSQAGASPNQRARRVGANVFLSAARSSDGPTISPLGEGPPRKLASTCATRP